MAPSRHQTVSGLAARVAFQAYQAGTKAVLLGGAGWKSFMWTEVWTVKMGTAESPLPEEEVSMAMEPGEEVLESEEFMRYIPRRSRTVLAAG